MNVGSCSARLLIALTLLSLAGCETRSISNSGYPAPYAGNMLYSGELNEFDLLGMGRNQPITDADIQQALAVKAPFRVKQRSSVMLIQSGAMFPDEPMMTSMAHHYIVGAFSGIPERDAVAAGSPNPPAPYSMALRLVAARGGYETIMVYWGILETARENLETKDISWLPFVGGGIVDESQRMRIRLKIALVDVRSGQWEMFAPEPLEDIAGSADDTRVSSDQSQVERLKRRGYENAVADIIRRYAG